MEGAGRAPEQPQQPPQTPEQIRLNLLKKEIFAEREFLINVCFPLLRNPHQAQDLADKTILKAIKCVDKQLYEERGSLRAYLATMARRLVIDFRKRNEHDPLAVQKRFVLGEKTEDDIEDTETKDPEKLLLKKEELARRKRIFEIAKSRLRPKERAALELSIGDEELGSEEIGERLHMTRRNAASSLSRAKKKLTDYIKSVMEK